MVAGDAARALGALGPRASPSVDALAKTLSHEDPYVRIYAAEALVHWSERGPGDTCLGRSARRSHSWRSMGGVRHRPGGAVCSAALIEALKDEFLYVRIFAAGALGSIGPKAQSAREALKAAANDPAMRHEAEWALNRIAGSHLVIGANERQRGSLASGAGRGAPASETVGESEGRSPSVKETSNPPIDWDPATGRNVVWSVGKRDVRSSRGCWRCGLCRHRQRKTHEPRLPGKRRRARRISREGR